MEHVKIEYKICEIYKTDDELIIRSDKSERWGSKTLMLITCFFVLTLLVPYFVFNALNILMFILSCVILLIELMITLISFRIVENKILVNKRKRLETSIYFIVVILVFYLLKTLFLPITPPLEYSLEYFSIGFLISFLIITGMLNGTSIIRMEICSYLRRNFNQNT